MEAYITPPDPNCPADPFARLLAAILAWLRALLAEHQAGLLPPTPPRRSFKRKTGKIAIQTPRSRAAFILARGPMPACPRAATPRDMTMGLPRPRLVAPS